MNYLPLIANISFMSWLLVYHIIYHLVFLVSLVCVTWDEMTPNDNVVCFLAI